MLSLSQQNQKWITLPLGLTSPDRSTFPQQQRPPRRRSLSFMNCRAWLSTLHCPEAQPVLLAALRRHLSSCKISHSSPTRGKKS